MSGINLPEPYVGLERDDPELREHADRVQANFNKIQQSWPAADYAHVVGSAGEPAFIGTWVASGGLRSSPGFTRIGDRVFLNGSIKNGVLGTGAFTLPSGWRPDGYKSFAVSSNGAYGQVDINAAGDVVPIVGSTLLVELSAINFKAA